MATPLQSLLLLEKLDEEQLRVLLSKAHRHVEMLQENVTLLTGQRAQRMAWRTKEFANAGYATPMDLLRLGATQTQHLQALKQLELELNHALIDLKSAQKQKEKLVKQLQVGHAQRKAVEHRIENDQTKAYRKREQDAEEDP